MTQQETPSSSNPRGYGADLKAEKPVEEMVLYEIVEPHICKITLNRPERHNALLEPDMWVELGRKINMAGDDDTVKVILLCGNGTSFCSGVDLRRPPVEAAGLRKGQRLPQSVRLREFQKVHEIIYRDFLYHPKPIVAAVQGAALGGGFHLTLQSDIIVAAENARFGHPESRIGFGGYAPFMSVMLLRMGINRGYEMIITGREVSAQELKEWGVIASIVPEDKLMDEGMRYARAIAAHSTDGIAMGAMAMQMFWDTMGIPTWSSFTKVMHSLFSNLVWRDDEFNFLKERNRMGIREAFQARNKIWDDLGFE